jgi:protein-tyrosine phosphatase
MEVASVSSERLLRGKMLDLHCHILPDVDDGAATLSEALEMARFCVADGISHITATPHCNRAWPYFRADILPRVAHLNKELARANIALTVLPGSEIQLTDVATYRADFEAGRFCHLGDGRAFTLLEFNWRGVIHPSDAAAVELVAWLRQRGMTAILAHPERHEFFRDDPSRLRALVDAGAWLQITVDSLLGNHGPAPQTAGEEMLRTYTDVVLATDAHNQRRCSGMSAGYAWVREHVGAQRAEDLRARSNRVLAQLLVGGAAGGLAESDR